jgi:BirA family biotin operon repressor/biotin-[acetyl-CoA-carboxylase] ligase
LYNAIYDTVIIAKKVIYLPSCHSTNDIAAELVRENSFQEGTIVITDEQTKGRGQRGSIWLTEPGQNLTMSIILKPFFVPLQEQFVISKAIAVGIWSYLNEYAESACIKWPNDLYLGEKKICGTLIENSIQGGQISSSIVGIGLNINQLNFSNARATSLSADLNQEFSLPEEFRKLVHHLDAFYLRVKSAAGRDEINDLYLNNLFGHQQVRKFKVDGKIKTGSITGVDPAGILRVHFEDSEQDEAFSNKEIEWVWED